MALEALEALARRVETEEPSDELTAQVLTAFGCESEAGSAPEPLTCSEDAQAFRPRKWVWRVYFYEDPLFSVAMKPVMSNSGGVKGTARTAACAWTAANLRAKAWEARVA